MYCSDPLSTESRMSCDQKLTNIHLIYGIGEQSGGAVGSLQQSCQAEILT